MQSLRYRRQKYLSEDSIPTSTIERQVIVLSNFKSKQGIKYIMKSQDFQVLLRSPCDRIPCGRQIISTTSYLTSSMG